MQAEPKTWGLSDAPEPMVHWGPAGKYAFIECVITDPPSSKGRTVNVLIEGEMVAQLLLELRSLAVKQRSVPDPARVRRSAALDVVVSVPLADLLLLRDWSEAGGVMSGGGAEREDAAADALDRLVAFGIYAEGLAAGLSHAEAQEDAWPHSGGGSDA